MVTLPLVAQCTQDSLGNQNRFSHDAAVEIAKSKSLSSSPNGFSSSARERWRPTVPQADTERSTRDGSVASRQCASFKRTNVQELKPEGALLSERMELHKRRVSMLRKTCERTPR